MWANYENNMKIEPKHERLSRTFPQRIPLVRDIFLIYYLLFENTLSK